MWYTRRDNFGARGLIARMHLTGRHVVFILIIIATLLSGCGRPALALFRDERQDVIEFKELFEERYGDRYKLETVQRINVDADGDDEWIIFYRFDQYESGQWANTPIHGIVYDAIPCELPLIEGYRLPAPANDYLSEGGISISLEDVLAEPGKSGGTSELVVFGGGSVQTLTFFRFFDRRTNPCLPVEEGQRGFTSLGFFRANAGIQRNGKTIVTKDRTVLERSQLSIQKSYLPREDLSVGETYFEPDGRPVAPREQSVAFTFGLPQDPRDSPYPEKSVATFYLALGSNNDKARSFLVDPLQPAFETSTGLPIPASQVGHVLIYSLSYTPDPEAERLRQDRFVEVVAAAVDKNGNRQPPRRLRWRLMGVPIPERQDCEWRMAELVSVTALGPDESPEVAAW